ncbi:MAG: cyclic nucleotide-binding domain-containing protein [Thiovulaceae bacterium]|nr:cyclic nucleotide-binding domain-containing protein [Sulfurimonadaceae bacterium]
MDINTLWDNFFTKSKTDSIVDFLQSISLFEDLKTGEILRLERALHKRHYRKGEVLFNEGEPGAALYIIKDGEVEVVINYESEPIVLTKLSNGMFFGEIALFDETPRSATVVASKECEIIALSKPDFILFSQKEPSIGFKIVMRLGEILSIRLKTSNKQIEELKSSHV